MSTNDVPGAKAANMDELAMGCWAEHEDGSLILVESTEGERVIYSVFDMATDPITEYRDSMMEEDFKKRYSWDDDAAVKWTWHDKTPFPWNRVIKEGAKDGLRYASAEDQLSAAARVAKSRHMAGKHFNPEEHAHLLEKAGPKGRSIIEKLQAALDAFKD